MALPVLPSLYSRALHTNRPDTTHLFPLGQVPGWLLGMFWYSAGKEKSEY